MEVKKENFRRISTNRVKKINDLISKLHNLINPSFYEFTKADVDDMFNEIQKELDEQKEYFVQYENKKNKRREL